MVTDADLAALGSGTTNDHVLDPDAVTHHLFDLNADPCRVEFDLTVVNFAIADLSAYNLDLEPQLALDQLQNGYRWQRVGGKFCWLVNPATELGMRTRAADDCV